MDKKTLNGPLPLMADDFELLQYGVYDSLETNVWINKSKDFVYLDSLPAVAYENYVPKVKQLGLSKYKKNSNVLKDRFEKIEHIIKDKKSILEIGSADGSFLKLVHKNLPNLLYYSVEPDISTSNYRDKLSWLTQYEYLSEAIEDNINTLKDALQTQYQYRIDQNTQDFINRFKRQYRAGSQNLVLSVGDSLEKVKESLGSPDKITDRINNNTYYTMLLYKLGNKNYRLFFEGNILFDLELVE